MITESAKVVSVNESGTYVETIRKTACGQCSVNKGCGTSVLSKVIGKKLSLIKVINDIDAREGDDVIIGLNEQSLVTGAVMVYILPLLLLFAFAILGKFVADSSGINNELITIAFAVAGFLLGMRKVKKFSGKISNDSDYQPVILKKAEAEIFTVSVAKS